MNKIELLQILQEKVSHCTKCPELVASRTRTVFGNGNPHSRIMLIGEASGRNEDEQGVPFVGRAGLLLNNLLAHNGLTREDVYVANILKCRPPNNRTPMPQECANCAPFLRMQIRIINPEYIVCLGGVAAQNLLKVETPISQLRGHWYDYDDPPVKAKVLASYHPAYLLRNPEAKIDTNEDLRMLLHKLQSGA